MNERSEPRMERIKRMKTRPNAIIYPRDSCLSFHSWFKPFRPAQREPLPAMNDDDTNLHPWIEPELEARLTALVLGEASDFERDELERLVADRPELGLYRKRLEAMHRMLREVAKGENAEEQGEWKLSPERRTAVLARLRGEAKAEEKVVVMPRSKRRVPWGMMIRIAACAAVIALFLGLMFPATTGALRKAERPNDGGSAFAYIDSGETSASGIGIFARSHGTPAPRNWRLPVAP